MNLHFYQWSYNYLNASENFNLCQRMVPKLIELEEDIRL